MKFLNKNTICNHALIVFMNPFQGLGGPHRFLDPIFAAHEIISL